MSITERVPFKGAVRRVPEVKPVFYNRGKSVCTCGMIVHYYTLLPKWHMEECIINSPQLYKSKKKNKKKKRRGRK
jgi:hypothetical protein